MITDVKTNRTLLRASSLQAQKIGCQENSVIFNLTCLTEIPFVLLVSYVPFVKDDH
jgi:hypothetical protein